MHPLTSTANPIVLTHDELIALIAADTGLARAYAVARARLVRVVELARKPKPSLKSPKTPEEKREAARLRQQKHRAGRRTEQRK